MSSLADRLQTFLEKSSQDDRLVRQLLPDAIAAVRQNRSAPAIAFELGLLALTLETATAEERTSLEEAAKMLISTEN